MALPVKKEDPKPVVKLDPAREQELARRKADSGPSYIKNLPQEKGDIIAATWKL